MQIRGREILTRMPIWTMLMRAAETTPNSATSAQSALCTTTLIVISCKQYDPLTEWLMCNERKKNLFSIIIDSLKHGPLRLGKTCSMCWGLSLCLEMHSLQQQETNIYLTYRSNNSRLCFHLWRPALYIEAILENLTSLHCR